LDWENSAFKILGLWFYVDLDRMVALNYKEKIDKMNKSYLIGNVDISLCMVK